MSERRPVTPSQRERRTALLHRHLQAVDTIYPPEIRKGGFGSDNKPLSILEALDVILIETGRHGATATQIGSVIDELYPPKPASERTRAENLIGALVGLEVKGFLKKRKVAGNPRRRLATCASTLYSRPADQQPITQRSR